MLDLSKAFDTADHFILIPCHEFRIGITTLSV